MDKAVLGINRNAMVPNAIAPYNLTMKTIGFLTMLTLSLVLPAVAEESDNEKYVDPKSPGYVYRGQLAELDKTGTRIESIESNSLEIYMKQRITGTEEGVELIIAEAEVLDLGMLSGNNGPIDKEKLLNWITKYKNVTSDKLSNEFGTKKQQNEGEFAYSWAKDKLPYSWAKDQFEAMEKYYKRVKEREILPMDQAMARAKKNLSLARKEAIMRYHKNMHVDDYLRFGAPWAVVDSENRVVIKFDKSSEIFIWEPTGNTPRKLIKGSAEYFSADSNFSVAENGDKPTVPPVRSHSEDLKTAGTSMEI